MLEHRRINLALLLIIITLFLLFFIGGPSYYSPIESKLFWNNGHIIFYCMTSFMIMKYLLKRSYSLISVIILILLYTLILGVLVEVVQSNLNREMDYADLYRNFLGSLLGILCYQVFSRQKNKITMTVLAFITVLIVIEQFALFSVLSLKYQQYKKLPILADFSLKGEVMFWSEGELMTNESENHRQSLKLTLATGEKYSGFTFNEVYQDWRNYRFIEFYLRSESQKAEKLCIKITDLSHDEGSHEYSDRFNYCPTLAYGKNVIEIPLDKIRNAPKTRTLNLAEISRIGFFMIDLTEEKTLYIDKITLK